MSESVGLEELVADWTLLEAERELAESKYAGTRLGFALLLKFFVAHGRFPAGPDDFTSEVVAFVARQVAVAPERLAERIALSVWVLVVG